MRNHSSISFKSTYKMKKVIIIFLGVVLLFSCNQSEKKEDKHVHHSTEKTTSKEENAKSPHKSAMANIGDVHVHIEYNSPSVRNRIIWGGLVPYNQVWVTGAHMATSIHFFGDVQIAGQSIPEGKYAFFTIPSEEEWTLVLNKNWDQHLTDEYDPEEDVIRWTVKPEISDHKEALSYDVIGGKESGRLVFRWEKIKFNFDIKA